MFCNGFLHGQLSPGELTKSHADLEGLFNCTKCHTLGQKIDENKCLDCHSLLQSRINEGKGFHVSELVKSQSCITCHSDHHGRNFDIVRFDKVSFNHYSTGYELEGAHVEQECISCHNETFIVDANVRDKDFTYLGLSTECLSCHDDYHQGSLSTNCSSCHTFDAFQSAPLFDHDATDFLLKGKHQQVDCILCHELVTNDSGKQIQNFSNIEFSNCTNCHEDVHNNRFGQNCTQCHGEDSFKVFKGQNRFNHNITDFSLKGKHKTVSCMECHVDGTDNNFPFHEFSGVSDLGCIACHDDVHEGRFGQNCVECHNENSFKVGSQEIEFDHNLTNFPLEGKHINVNCTSCHPNNLIDPVAHTKCINCHSDFHDNEFTSNGKIRNCNECHAVSGFQETTFTVDQHNESNFYLEGAHLATPCFSCHLDSDQWKFKDIGIKCVECHDNIHKEVLASKFYPEENCEACHNVNQWASVTFDHNQADFKIEGAHTIVTCSACHLDKSESDGILQFNNISSACSTCHEDSHNAQFKLSGNTDCARCHDSLNWSITNFDHKSTAFPLDGEHINVNCNSCHKEKTENNITFIQYKIQTFKCASCHL